MYENFGKKDDFSNTVLRSMELLYVFNDYDAGHLADFLASHTWGRNRTDADGQENQAIDAIITNYRLEHMEGFVSSGVFAEMPSQIPVIYSTHACARKGLAAELLDYPKEMEYLKATRRAGVPVFDLCSMSKQAVTQRYDVQARKQGREGDPHLCMPGPHLEMMETIFQMLVNLLIDKRQ